MTTRTSSGQPARDERPAGDAAEETPLAKAARPFKWLGLTVAGGLATIIAGAVVTGWSWAQDQWREFHREPRISAIVYSPENEGISFALPRAVTSGPDRRRLLAGDYEEVLRSGRGARIGEMKILLVLRGRRNDPIRVLDVRPRILSSGPVAAGTCLSLSNAGESPVFPVKADLDRLAGAGSGSSGRLLEKNLDLVYGERASVELTVTARKRSYEWDIEVSYVYGDSPGVQRDHFTAEGGPFRLTGPARRYAMAYGNPMISRFREIGRNVKRC
ncbi:hypothetical protein AB0F88_02290 [Streptosporangium sp. NPDC023963]|uniref:hypothetical protein n=1 Tax=Streptosporangium sp. NPDC023963 TaxID=3155608 RepID=UPI00343991D2